MSHGRSGKSPLSSRFAVLLWWVAAVTISGSVAGDDCDTDPRDIGLVLGVGEAKAFGFTDGPAPTTDVTLLPVQLVSFQPAADGSADVVGTGTVTNRASVALTAVSAVPVQIPDGIVITPPTTITFGSLGPHGTGTAMLHCRVPLTAYPDAAAAARGMDALVWSFEATEPVVWAPGVVVLQAGAFQGITAEGLVGTPAALAGIQPGNIVMMRDIGGCEIPAGTFPFRVARIETSASVTTLVRDPEPVPLEQCLVSGRLAGDYGLYGDQPRDRTLGAGRGAHRGRLTYFGEKTTVTSNIETPAASTAPELSFNEVTLADGLTVGGRLGLAQLRVQPDVRIRGGRVEEVRITLTEQIVAAWRITAHKDLDLPETRKQLFHFDLPVASIGAGTTVGATFSISGGVTFGVAGQLRSGVELTDVHTATATQVIVLGNGDPVVTQQVESSGLDRTPPLVSATMTGNFTAFALAKTAVKATLTFCEVPLASLSAGPEFTTSGILTLKPLESEWWTFEGRYRLGLDLAGSVLGFSALDRSFTAAEGQMFRRSVESGIQTAVRRSQARPTGLGPEASASDGERQRWSVGWTQRGSMPNEVDAVLFPDGGMAVVFDSNSLQTEVVKLDPFGQVLWQRTCSPLGGVSDARATADGGVLLFGTLFHRLLKLDANGKVQWSRRLEFPGGTKLLTMDVSRTTTGEDRIAVAGLTLLPDPGEANQIQGQAFVVGLDSRGQVIWANTYPQSGSDAAYRVVGTPRAGGFLMVGASDAPLPDDGKIANVLTNRDTSANGYVVKLRDDGSAEWAHIYESEYLVAAAEDENGFAVTGAAAGTLLDPYHGASFHRLSRSGDVISEFTLAMPQTYTSPAHTHLDVANSVISLPDGWIVASAAGYLDHAGGWALRINRNGAPIWAVDFGGPGADRLTRLKDRGDGFVTVRQHELPAGQGGGLWAAVVPDSGLLNFGAALSPAYRDMDIDGFGGPTVLNIEMHGANLALEPISRPMLVESIEEKSYVVDVLPSAILTTTVATPSAPRPILMTTGTSGLELVWPLDPRNPLELREAATLDGPSIRSAFTTADGLGRAKISTLSTQRYFHLARAGTL